MAIDLRRIKRVVGIYLTQDKPEPHLAIKIEGGIEAEALDWMGNVGFNQEGEFWVISRQNAQKSVTYGSIDWDTHWRGEKERTLSNVRKGLGRG